MDVEDCVSITISYILENIKSGPRQKQSFESWVLLITYHRAVNRLKQLNKEEQNRQSYLQNQKQSTVINILDIIVWQEYIKRLMEIFKSFDKQRGEALIRRILDEESPKQISKDLDIDVDQIYYWTKEDKKKLRKLVKELNDKMN